MPKQIISQHSFAGGEIDPKASFRSDTDNYKTGLKKAINCLLDGVGGCYRRPGFLLTTSTKDSTKKSRLIKYTYSKSVSQVLEIGDGYVRFYNKNGLVLDSSKTNTLTSSNITRLSSTSVQLDTTHILNTTQQFFLELTGDNNDPNLTSTTVPYKATTATGTGTVVITATNVPSPLTTNGAIVTVPYELTTNITEAMLGSLQFTSYEDKLYIACGGSIPVQVFTRTADNTWSISDFLTPVPATIEVATGTPFGSIELSDNRVNTTVDIYGYYPSGYIDTRKTITAITNANPGVVTSNAHGFVNGDTIEIDFVNGMTQLNTHIFTVASATTNTFALSGEDTTSYGTYISGGLVGKYLDSKPLNIFNSSYVGKYIMVANGLILVTSHITDQHLLGTVLQSPDTAVLANKWTLAEDTWSTSKGWQKCVSFFQNRLWFANSTTYPTSIWASNLGLYNNFGFGANDDDAISEIMTIDGEISWLMATQDLIVGGLNSESAITSSTNGIGVTPTDIQQTTQTSIGSLPQQPVKINEEIIFIEGTQNKVRNLVYNALTAAYSSSDLTYLVAHLSTSKIVDITYSKHPNSVVYAVTGDGRLLYGIYDRNNKVIGWTQYITDGFFEAVSLVEQSDNDIIYGIIKRHINGVWVRYVEKLVVPNSLISYDEADPFSDCSTISSNAISISSISTINGAIVTTNMSHGLISGDTIIFNDIVDELPSDKEHTIDLSTLNKEVFLVEYISDTTFALKDFDNNSIDLSDYNDAASYGNLYKRVLTLYNLHHLEGKLVKVIGDGASQSDETVYNGSITLTSPAGEIVVGLKVDWTMQLLEQDFSFGQGSMLGQQVIWNRALVRIISSTLPLLNGHLLPSRDLSDLMDVSPSLRTGYVGYGTMSYSLDEKELLFTSDVPLPVNILGITGTVNSGVL